MQIRLVGASESFATGCSSSRLLIQWYSPIGNGELPESKIHLPTDLQPWGVPLTTTGRWLALNNESSTYLSHFQGWVQRQARVWRFHSVEQPVYIYVQ